MKPNLATLITGVVLITLGGFALAFEAGYLETFSSSTWALICAVASVLFLIAYFAAGVRAWGWLFPVCIFAGVSAALALTGRAPTSLWIPTLILGSVAVPFLIAYILDRSRTWALIPLFVLGVIAFIPVLSGSISADSVAGFILAMIGLPFIVVFLIKSEAWWAILPGGILVSIALMIVLQGRLPDQMGVALMFLGWMVTFGLVWLRQGRTWAKAVTLVLGVSAVVMALVALGLEMYWSLGLIAAGLVLVVASLRPRKITEVK